MDQDQQKRFYRICPTYKEVPLYNNKIGVMIDVRANDSIWFDVDKLQTILSFAAESRKSFNSQREIEKKTVDPEPISQQDDIYVIKEDTDKDEVLQSRTEIRSWETIYCLFIPVLINIQSAVPR